MAAPRITVLIPTHQRADVVGFAIRSVLAQTVQDFELFVVGDGCSDETADVVTGFADARIRWFDLPKAPGFGYGNRNVALREAQGDVVAYLAHDDLWLPDHLEQVAGALDDPRVEFAHSLSVFVLRDGTLAAREVNLLDPRDYADLVEHGHFLVSSSTLAHRRAALDRYGWWDATIHQGGDVELWGRIVHGAGLERVRYVSDVTSLHFVASWRPDDAPHGVLATWLDWYDAHPALPGALRVPLEPGQPEQAAVWALLEPGLDGWATELRRAFAENYHRRRAFDRREIERLEREVRRLGRAEAQARRKLESFRATRGWRLLEQVRRVRRGLLGAAPPGGGRS